MAGEVMQVSKEKFLAAYAKSYGYKDTIDSIRDREFARLKDVTYLDHVGATLYSKSQIESYAGDLQGSIYGNPHSRNNSSQLSSEIIEELRHLVVRHFNTNLENHHVIFTSGATGALKILAENFDWSQGSRFVFLEDNHTSVVGMREIALREGSAVSCVSEMDVTELFGSHLSALPCGIKHDTVDDKEETLIPSLFSYPAMSNFCGRKYPLDWVRLVKQSNTSIHQNLNQRWYVLLDAASYVGTNKLDLSQVDADFVPVSFYKMFGFPTGVGALIVKADAVSSLKPKCYYGGGTVLSTISNVNHHVLKTEISERYEDGTVPFLDIIALRHGFHWLKAYTGSMQAVQQHTFALTQYTFREVKSMVHYNGVSLCKLYCDGEYVDSGKQGSVINFNVVNVNGEYIGYTQVEKLANLSKIHLRTGCFCNTGDCQKHLGLTTDAMLSHYNAGHVCGDQMDLIEGRPTGSVRISFGYMSTFEDAWTFLNFLRECFLVSEDSHLNEAACQAVPEAGIDDCSQHGTQTDDACDKGSANEENVRRLITAKQEITQNNLHHAGRIPTHIADSNNNSSPNDKIEAFKLSSIVHRDDARGLRGLATNAQSGFAATDQNLKMFKRKGNELKRIFIYPVKSCGAFEVSEWWLSEKGLLYDREWMILSEYGSVLTQKKEQRMVFIKPVIDIGSNTLTLKCQGFGCVSVSLQIGTDAAVQAFDRQSCSSRVCGEKVSCDDCGNEVAAWLSDVLGRPCRLVKQSADQKRIIKRTKAESDQNEMPEQHQISLANESQYLLISETSLLEVFKHFKRSKNLIKFDELVESFRANFVMNGHVAFEEDNWNEINVDELKLKVKGKCQRCQMICINQTTAERNREPLETLVRIRGSRMEFGIYLISKMASKENCLIKIGDEIVPAM